MGPVNTTGRQTCPPPKPEKDELLAFLILLLCHLCKAGFFLFHTFRHPAHPTTRPQQHLKFIVNMLNLTTTVDTKLYQALSLMHDYPRVGHHQRASNGVFWQVGCVAKW